MDNISIEHNPSPAKLDVMNIDYWPIWRKEVSEFPWTYDKTETCYFIEGEAIVTPENGEPVKMGESDLVIFPAGMSCHWKIIKPVKKHYTFS